MEYRPRLQVFRSMFWECSVDGLITDCVWEIIPNDPGSVVGEAKTGMLSPDNAYVPGVAWSYVYFGTGDMFERVSEPISRVGIF